MSSDSSQLQQDVMRMMRFLESADDRSAIKDLLQSLQVAQLDPTQLMWELNDRRNNSAAGDRSGGGGGGSRHRADTAASLFQAVVAATHAAGRDVDLLEGDEDDDDDDDTDPALAVLTKGKSTTAAMNAIRRRQQAAEASAAAAAAAGYHASDVGTQVSGKAPSGAAGQQQQQSAAPVVTLSSGFSPASTFSFDEAFDSEDTEDRLQISRMFAKLERLSLSTLRLALTPWVPADQIQQQNAQQLRCRVVETVRYLAAMYLITVADKFHCLPDGDTNSAALISNLMLSLWQGIGLLANNVRDHIALLLGVPVPATPDEVCVAVSGLGLGAFFSSLSVSVLNQLCKELGVDYSMSPAIDPDVVTDVLSERLSAHFYPTLVNRFAAAADPSTPGQHSGFCSVKTTVHENAPNHYTVTLDNACLLSMVGHRSYVSAPFACAKARWRAKVSVSAEDSMLSISVSHRASTAFNIRLSVRSQTEGKAKKQQQAISGTAAAAAAANSSVLLEQTVSQNGVTAGQPVTISKLFNVRALLKDGKGPRNVYNQVEDRLVFQISLYADPAPASPNGGVEVVGVGPATAKGGAKAAAAAAAAQSQPSAGGKAGKKADAAAAGAVDKSSTGKGSDVAAVTASGLAELVADEENERKKKALEKARAKLKERFKALETTESQARQTILTSSTQAFAAIGEEAKASKQRALAKIKERERKHELSLAQPVVELQAQLNALTNQAAQARAAITKLSQERAALQKDHQKVASQIAAREKELEVGGERCEELQGNIAEADAEITRLEAELQEAEEVRARAARIQFLTSGIGGPAAPTMAPVAAITDMSAFWSTPSSTPTRTGSHAAGSGWLPY